MSPGFQGQDFDRLVFPNKMLVDYVRVYQRKGHEDWSCSPKHHPTEEYINEYVNLSDITSAALTRCPSHLNAYTNANLTTWDQAGYAFPRNSEWDTC